MISKITEKITEWFSVSDAQMTEILAKVRAELPTTEVLLLGKPQVGKSSIVRGLTGVSPAIIGQGFRPHTQHTQRYDYPSSDLPLLIFIDTVGWGDAQQSLPIVDELMADLQPNTKTARILVLTVKINDFAIDYLRQTALEIRRKYPQIPCLLAVTCLHEVYPQSLDNHLAYPPNFPEIERPFQAIKESLQGTFDRAVLIDFTLEEDGYDPVFYGLAALTDNLAELLPEAESKAINQLLDRDALKQIGDLYRNAARHYILAFTIIIATVAALPLPFASMPVITALQASMIVLLGKLYGQILTVSQAGGIISAIAGGFLAQAIGREVVKFIPGLGSAIAASWSAAYTYALGEAACAYFGDLMGGKKPDPQKIKLLMRESFEAAKARFKIN